jgi:hypothetical protein
MSRLSVTAWLAAGLALLAGCEGNINSPLVLKTEPVPASRPDAAPASQPSAKPAPLPSFSNPDGRPGQIIQAGQPGQPATQPASPGINDPGDSLGVPIGPPAGTVTDFTMPGRGLPSIAGDDATRKRAALQAAMVVAIYNVTKECNPHSFRDNIEKGYRDSDHFRYRDGPRDGLEVKSQTTVIAGLVTQFDVWLIVPAGPDAEANEKPFQVQVRNFRLVGNTLTPNQVERLLARSGKHLVVTQTAGPDEHGRYTVDVGLVRNPK